MLKVDRVEVNAGGIVTNCYLIIKDNNCLIVDPGDEEAKIIDRITNLKLVPLAILTTHSHFDHISALMAIANYYNLSTIDSKNYENDAKKIAVHDFSFQIIKTLGHNQDSVSFYFPLDNILFSGDFIFYESIGRCDLKGGNFEEMENSLRKLLTFPNETKIYPGHGEETTLEHEKEFNEFLKAVM